MDALGINLGQLTAQTVNLVVLLVALGAFLYKPVLAMLDERAERIQQSMEDAAAASKKAAQAEAEYQKRISEAQTVASAMVEQASSEAQAVRERTLANAREEAQQLLERARREIELERQEALRTEKAQLADLVIAAASKVIARELDETAHRQLIDEFLSSPAESL